MNTLGFPLLLLLTSAATTTSLGNAPACSACNCQFNNVQVPSQLIDELVDARVNQILSDEPLVRLMTIWMNKNWRLQLYAANHSTLQGNDDSLLAQVTISDSSQAQTSTNNLLAYRPRYNDYHNSNLAGVFINLEGVFPCLAPLTNYFPICHVFTQEEDGFRNGRALIDAGDLGNHFQVFSSSSNILTYGIAIQQCPEFNATCFPLYHSFKVACYLPRSACS